MGIFGRNRIERRTGVSNLLLVGRLLYSLMFIMYGVNHFIKLDMMAQYTGAMGVPAPKLAVVLTGVMILAGGLSVLLGYKAKLGAAIIFLFLVPTSVMMHAFWTIEDPMQAMPEMAQFFKNLSMAGAALMITYFGSGPKSLEATAEELDEP